MNTKFIPVNHKFDLRAHQDDERQEVTNEPQPNAFSAKTFEPVEEIILPETVKELNVTYTSLIALSSCALARMCLDRSWLPLLTSSPRSTRTVRRCRWAP